MSTIIQTNQLSKSYGKQRGILDVTFDIQEGEVFGFLGPNGAGKTTTTRVLMGLLRPSSGSASIGGLDCWQQSTEVKKLVGYLPGEFTFDPNLRGAQIIEYLGHLRRGVDQSYVRNLCERLDFVLDVTGREIQGSWVQYLSPFYYYNLNRPLLPTFHNQPGAALILPALAILCVVASLVLFVRRDSGRAAFAWQREHTNTSQRRARNLSRAEHALSTRSITTQTIAAQAWSAFWWLLGIILLCVYCTILIPSIQPAFEKIVLQTPWLAGLFFDTPTNSNSALLGTLMFSFLPPLVVVFALTQALRWSADLENGRLELLFSTPNSRARVLLARYGATLLLVLLAPVLTWLALWLGALILNISINQSLMAAASFTTLPLALITLGLVFALAGRLRYSAVLGILTAYLALSFLEESFEGLVAIPSWIGWLSIFHLYGNPVFLGIDWGKTLGMTAVGLALLLVGLWQFRAADIQRG